MQKSKKDLAFDKERAKFRSEIRQLKGDIQSKDMQIRGLMCRIGELENKIRELEDWNARLLEYMDMPEEDMRKILIKNKTEAEITELFKSINSVLRRIGIF